jgi:hypothetical protein
MNKLKVKQITISKHQDSKMLEMIYNVVDSYYIEKNTEIKKTENKDIKKTENKDIKLISFPHKIFLEIFNNKNILVITHFNFNDINIFNSYTNISKNIDMVKQIISELKEEMSNIIDCYNYIITKYEPKDFEVIINHFNLNYLYKLIIKFETNIKKMNILLNIIKYIIDTTIPITEKIQQIEDKKKDLILLHKIVEITHSDILTKCNDIY